MSEAETLQKPASDAVASATILFVDDEVNILASLKRLFRPFGYKILTAESGAQALEVMEQEAVDLVISDMRMPEMNGAQFLEKVREKWPETIRILLTGYSEVGATIDAINKGQIYRYISKPWEDNDITQAIKLALQQQQLERERARLETLTHQQNAELKDLNANLEEKVRARTEEVRHAMASLEVAHEKLKGSFITSIRIFSNLIEMREEKLAGHSRRVADLSRAVAQHMEIKTEEVQDIFLAALLHDVGKIGLHDSLLDRPYEMLTHKEQVEAGKHTIKGQAALMALDQLHGAAKLIRSHHERFDGHGYPDNLAGTAIPLGARILALANDFDAAQIGTLLPGILRKDEAISYIQQWKGTRYDPAVVTVFLHMMVVEETQPQKASDIILNTKRLKPGMVTSRDVIAGNGELLLGKSHALDETVIEQLQNFERMGGTELKIYIQDKG